MDVFIIYGTTGEYSDHILWTMGIVENEKEARNYVNFMNDKLKGSGDLTYQEKRKLIDSLKNYDSNIKIDYTGTSYKYEKIKMNDIPKILIGE